MITIDPRAGSNELLPDLASIAEYSHLEFGDLAWVGNGPDDLPVTVGIEFKRLGDMIQCIGQGRFVGHQLPGLINTYQYPYLLIEGLWTRGGHGEMVTRRGTNWVPVLLGGREFMIRDFEGWLTTIETMAGIRIRKSRSRKETIATIRDLYEWWTCKEFDHHRSMCQFDNSQDLTPMLKPGLVRRVAAQLPGISWVRSQHVAARFESVLEMACAGVEDWMKVKWQTKDGRNQGIGKGIAEKVVKAIRGES